MPGQSYHTANLAPVDLERNGSHIYVNPKDTIWAVKERKIKKVAVETPQQLSM